MKKSDLLSNLLTIVLVVCAVVVTGLVVRRELFTRAADERLAISPRGEEPGWERFTSGFRRAGPAEAAVRIVEFSDFQCPYCRLMAARLDSVRADAPDVSVEYRHFPLRTHAHAVAAARASDCALEQGRFWEMHDALFRGQDSIGLAPWTRYAASAEVRDAAAFARCMGRGAEHPAFREDTVAGNRLGVVATPTILINQYRFVGALPLDTLRAYITKARERRD